MFWTFHKMPVIYATYLSAFPTFAPADGPSSKQCLRKTIVDQYLMFPLACWIQLCFVSLHRNKMTVITSETIVLYFNLIAHWQSYTQKRILNFEKKYVAVACLNIEKRGSSQVCSFHR